MKSLLYIIFLMGGMATPLQAEEKDLYDFLWLDPDKKVFVLQNKLFKKKGTFYSNLGYIKGLSSDFQSTKGLKLNAGYFLSEQFALELSYHKYFNSDNDALINIKQINQSVPFIRRPEQLSAIHTIWSPFYGKINTFNKIFYFNWSFGLGLGQYETSSNADTVSSPTESDSFKDESHVTLLTSSRLRFHVNKDWHIDIDYMRSNYRAKGALIEGQPQNKSWSGYSEIGLAIGFSF